MGPQRQASLHPPDNSVCLSKAKSPWYVHLHQCDCHNGEIIEQERDPASPDAQRRHGANEHKCHCQDRNEEKACHMSKLHACLKSRKLIQPVKRRIKVHYSAMIDLGLWRCGQA